MKVALFADTFLPQINGVTSTLLRIIENFEEKGVQYKLFVPKYETDAGVDAERFYSIKFFLYPEARISFPNFFRINASLAEFKPDIVHNMTEFFMGTTGLGYGRAHGVPTVSNYTTNFSQYAEYYKLNILKPTVWNWMRWFHTQSTFTLCPSLSAQYILNSQGITNTGIFSRGIDAKKFHPMYRRTLLREALGIADKTAFLYVGRLSVEKDLDVLSTAWQMLREKYENRAALIVTGDGPYMEKCRRSFPQDTIFTGIKTGLDLSEIYASCDVFVCPSSTETFGNVVLEAMASGLPVIGSNAGGVGELIRDGENGLAFASRDAESLYSCMKRLLLGKNLAALLRAGGRAFAQCRSWSSIIDGLMDTYRAVIESYLAAQKIA